MGYHNPSAAASVNAKGLTVLGHKFIFVGNNFSPRGNEKKLKSKIIRKPSRSNHNGLLVRVRLVRLVGKTNYLIEENP